MCAYSLFYSRVYAFLSWERVFLFVQFALIRYTSGPTTVYIEGRTSRGKYSHYGLTMEALEMGGGGGGGEGDIACQYLDPTYFRSNMRYFPRISQNSLKIPLNF